MSNLRKELTVFVKTTDIDDDSELMVQSTKQPGVVLITLPNGMKVGLEAKALSDALFELELFKSINSATPIALREKLPGTINAPFRTEWIDETEDI